MQRPGAADLYMITFDHLLSASRLQCCCCYAMIDKPLAAAWLRRELSHSRMVQLQVDQVPAEVSIRIVQAPDETSSI